VHWLKLTLEVWVVWGVVSVVGGLIWTARLRREINPQISEARHLSELAVGSPSKRDSAQRHSGTIG
jgi:hypothetical protein